MIRWLLTLSLLAVGAGRASAADIGIAWDGCPMDWSSPTAKFFDCDDNDAAFVFYGAVTAPSGLTQVTGEEITIDALALGGSPMPDWWGLESGGCREGGLAPTAAFFPTPGRCKRYWSSSTQGGWAWQPVYDRPSFRRLLMVFAQPAASARPMDAESTYFVFKVTLTTQSTVPDSMGASACPGCGELLCFNFLRLLLTQPVGVGDVDITYGTRVFLTWQHDTAYNCYVPTRRTTWGGLKSLYR